MKDARSCDCSRPWPQMIRLGIGGLDRYYLCLECRCVRHETASGPGLVDDIFFHHWDDPKLPEIIWREARRILDRPIYSQPLLFEREWLK